MFWAEIWKISEFLFENFQFMVVKFSIYLNRRVFVMIIVTFAVYLYLYFFYTQNKIVSTRPVGIFTNSEEFLVSLICWNTSAMIINFHKSMRYEGVSINNQPIPFPMDRDGHDFHALFQYMFYTWVQNFTRSSDSLIRYWMSNMASDAKACFSSKVEYRAVIRYFYLKGKTGKEIHGELAGVYGSSAPSYAQVKF